MSKPELIIDPGHGGRDGGGGTNEHWKEKDLVLKISLYQFERFKELGVPVALTRDKDVYLGPDKRTDIVKNSGAEYCLSNHINAGGGDGAEFIHSIYSNGEVEQKMAKAIKEDGQNVRRVFTRHYPGNSNLDYYYMHRETGSVKTTIAEYGFADSPRDDVAQLKRDWEKYAESIVKVYTEHLGHKYEAPKVAEEKPDAKGKLYKVQTGAFAEKRNADALAKKLKDDGFDTYIIKEGRLYKVQVGAYSKKGNAEAMEKELHKYGHKDTFIRYE